MEFFLSPVQNWSDTYMNRYSLATDTNRSGMGYNLTEAMVVEAAEMEQVYLGLVISFGVTGNIFSLFVFLTSPLRSSASSVYLAALALSDTIFLLVMSLVWMNGLNLLDLYSSINIICKSSIYIMNICACTSTWIVVLFTVERFLVIVHPFHDFSRPSRWKARRNVFMLYPISLVWYSVSFKFTGLVSVEPSFNRTDAKNNTQTQCNILPWERTPALIFHAVDMFVILLVPLMLIVTLNICIGKELLQAKRKKSWLEAKRQLKRSEKVKMNCLRSFGSSHSRMSLNPMLEQESSHSLNAPQDSRMRRVSMPVSMPSVRRAVRDIKTTKMLFLVSCVFVFLNLPHNVLRLREMISVAIHSSFQATAAEYLLQNICLALYYANFAINFMLYNLGSCKFRSYAIMLLRRVFCCQQPPAPRKYAQVVFECSNSTALQTNNSIMPHRLSHANQLHCVHKM